jgi:aquaglyceroporin related protein
MTEDLAELVGAFVIILFGAAAQCQAQLYPTPASSVMCLVGWASGVSLGATLAGTVSGGHVNPAVTVTMAVMRKFPWKKVPRYIIAQTVGCLLATFVVYGIYRDAIRDREESIAIHHSIMNPVSAAGNFVSIPVRGISLLNAYFDEFIGAAILIGFIAAFSDDKVHASTSFPFYLFIVVATIASSFGAQTGFAINPARDFGPRLALYLLGYKDVWTHDSAYWFWGIWLSSVPGGLVGAAIVDSIVYTGSDSVLSARFRPPPALP